MKKKVGNENHDPQEKNVQKYCGSGGNRTHFTQGLSPVSYPLDHQGLLERENTKIINKLCDDVGEPLRPIISLVGIFRHSIF